MRYLLLFITILLVTTAQGMKWAYPTLPSLSRQLFKVRSVSPLAPSAIPDSPPTSPRPLTVDRWQQPKDLTSILQTMDLPLDPQQRPQFSKALQFPTGVAGYHQAQAEKGVMKEIYRAGKQLQINPSETSRLLYQARQQRAADQRPGRPSSIMGHIQKAAEPWNVTRRVDRTRKWPFAFPQSELGKVVIEQSVPEQDIHAAEQLIVSAARSQGIDPKQIRLILRTGGGPRAGWKPSGLHTINLDLTQGTEHLPFTAAHEVTHLAKKHRPIKTLFHDPWQRERQLLKDATQAMIQEREESNPMDDIESLKFGLMRAQQMDKRIQRLEQFSQGELAIARAEELEADTGAHTQSYADYTAAESFIHFARTTPQVTLKRAQTATHPASSVRTSHGVNILGQMMAEQQMGPTDKFRIPYYFGEESFALPMIQKSNVIRVPAAQ